MNKKFKFASAFLSAGLLITPVSGLVNHYDNVAKAESIHKPKIEKNSVVGGALIFVAGIAVGYIADGVITYYTGKTPSEWVQQSIPYIENQIRNAYWRTNGNSQIHVNDGYVSTKCIKYPCELY